MRHTSCHGGQRRMQGEPGNERGRTRLRLRAQGTQGEDLSWQLQKSRRLPGGGGARQELEDPRGSVRASQAWTRRLDSPSTRWLPRLEQSRGRGTRPLPGHFRDQGWGKGSGGSDPCPHSCCCEALWALGSLVYKTGHGNDTHRYEVWCVEQGVGKRSPLVLE